MNAVEQQTQATIPNRAIVFCALCIVLAACSTTDNTAIDLPPGNVAGIAPTANLNTPADEIAPVQRPDIEDTLLDPCQRELEAYRSPLLDGIRTSHNLVGEITNSAKGVSEARDRLMEYIAQNLESISFMTHNYAVAALSHPPTMEYARKLGIDMDDSPGGTDLFLLNIPDDPFVQATQFRSLPEGINTKFWDSHPFVIDTFDVLSNSIITLLLWSSDRNDAFRTSTALQDSARHKGHADLYYAFGRRTRGEKDLTKIIWSPARSLDAEVNTTRHNEGSPFVYCLCNPASTVLFFSSNRGGRENDYDIYSVRIKVDFDQQNIEIVGDAAALPRIDVPTNEAAVNSRFDERFPWVAWPMDDPDNTWLYFNSDRFHDSVATGKNRAMQNKGSHDIYRTKLDPSFTCTPLKVVYRLNVAVLDAVDSLRPVHDAVVRIRDIRDDGDGLEFNITKNSEFETDIKQGCCYEIFGGSLHRGSIECSTPGDSALIGYCPPDVRLAAETVLDRTGFQARNEVRTFDNDEQLAEPGTVLRDTAYLNEFRELDGRRIDITSIRLDTVQKKASTAGGKYELTYSGGEQQTHFLREFRAITGVNAKACNSSDFILGTVVPSETTRNGRTTTLGMKPTNARGDTVVIYDTVYVVPQFRPKPVITLNVELQDLHDKRDTVTGPIIELLADDGKGNFAVVESAGVAKAQFKLECGRQYQVRGGSKFEGASCEAGNCIELKYYQPERRPGTNALIRGTMPLFIKGMHQPIKGAEVNSEITTHSGGIFTAGITSDTTINDIVGVQPRCYPKPPCDIEFKTRNVAIPYFQTGMWEVNTEDNLARHLVELDTDADLNYDEPSPAEKRDPRIRRWIELHKMNKYWRYKPSERQDRIDEYQNDFAPAVTTNLDAMAGTVVNEWLPYFLLVDSIRQIQDRPDSKLVIECMAFSDRRPVTHGWYIGENVDYIQGELQIWPDYRFNTKPITIRELDDLDRTNETLSDLRAWFGYKELKNRLDVLKADDNGKTLFEHFATDEVITPETLGLETREKFMQRVKDAKLIVLAKGYKADPFRVDSSGYINNSRTVVDYYDYDPIRRVNVRVRIIEMMDDAIIPNDCCTEPKIHSRLSGMP